MKAPKSVITMMGRVVKFNSPAQSPRSSDPFARQPIMEYTDIGGPRPDSGATDSLARATKKASRLKRRPGEVG